ncbi:MAG: hypothetical protein COA78_29865 [Blastopirellula sp.]|nr:MAG: hypothetical protein COA78_29865 [Blastopirellula sp.]
MNGLPKNKRRKVLHIRSTIGMYGAERVLLNTLPLLNETYDTTLLILEGGGTDSRTLRTQAEANGITCIHYNPRRKFDRKLIKDIEKVVKENVYNIIHTHDYKSLFYLSSISKKLNIPAIHHVHGALGNSYLENIYGIIEKWMMRNVTKILTVSSEQKQSLEKSCLKFPVISQVNNGTLLQPLDLHRSKTDTLKLIMVARFTAEKNHSLAIEAISTLKNMGLNISLSLLGDGPLKREVQQCIDAKSLSKQVQLVGFTSDVKTWLDDSDVLLITSETEGMPMNMLEAMGRGLPVISTPVGEIPFLINNSGCGELFSNHDDLVKLIEKITKEMKVWEEYGVKGRKYIENYLSEQSQVKVLINEYDNLLDLSDD